MIFIDNKYTKWYYAIIERANSRLSQTDDVESHHIIPDCFFANRSRKGTPGTLVGNPNAITNIVKLTTREHFVCHLLLTKMVTGRQKYQMLQAATAFVKWASKKHARGMINSRMYLILKKERNETLRKLWAFDSTYRTNALSGLTKLVNDTEHKSSMSALRKKLWEDDAYREKMKNRTKTFKKVMINGVIYNSLKEAGAAFNITPNCVSKRCSSKSSSYTAWSYVE